MASRPVLIHPGYHKTGTTFLQEVLFSDSEYFRQPWSREFISAQIIEPHELFFDAKRAQTAFANGLTAVAEGILPVLSEEGLSGNPFNGARESAIIARKLRAIFDDAKIFITIRRQQPMLRAVYVQYLKAYGRRSPRDFYIPRKFPEFSCFDASIYEYHRLADLYGSLFGKENILVIPQELLRADEAKVLALLGEHIGMDISRAGKSLSSKEEKNVSPPLSGAPFIRLGNHFSESAFNERNLLGSNAILAAAFRSLGYRFPSYASRKAKEFEEIIAGFSGRFAASNQALMEYCPIDLRALGYEVA